MATEAVEEAGWDLGCVEVVAKARVAAEAAKVALGVMEVGSWPCGCL